MRRADATDDGRPHRCRGVACPHVVNTGEALVCALTGVCVGDVVMASYDFVSTTSLCRERKNKSDDASRGSGALTERRVSTFDDEVHDDGETSTGVVVSDDDADSRRGGEVVRREPASSFPTTTRSGADLADTKNEKLYGECYRVVETLFGECEGASSAWKDALALRCRDCHVLCVSALGTAAASKIKSDYACLAALYLMREGLVIKGTRVCEVDERVATNIPSLNAVTKFGFQKSKYTRAYRTLMEAIDNAQYVVPLHELKI